ncbi:FlgO family outer membrane protein [Algibacillus agarilyticus]|uniref:FlgO family outer membrane protein n=1 Tax=Algibacillus agarilyticus TaxID=2234133 RepID=UPI000DCFB4D7|nr:FlgO family outer membrane protein [Algibacillus agarilyticus]
MTRVIFSAFGFVCLCLCLSGCTFTKTHSYEVPKAPEHSAENYYSPKVSELSVKAYTYILADELLLNLSAYQLAGSIVVANWVDEKTREKANFSGHPLIDLGGQLEEGFVYELTKRGFSVIDYKLMPSIKISEQGDQIWSRDVNQLSGKIDARYILSGTLTEHEKGAVVNVRLIQFDNKKVISAAQGFIPTNVFHSEDNISLRNGYLQHNGERRRTY